MVSNKTSLANIAFAFIVALASGACTNRTILSGVEKKVSGAVQSLNADKPIAQELKVWFVKPTSDNLQLVSVERPSLNANLLSNAVEELLRGPTSDEVKSGLSTEIPKGTILIGVKNEGDDIELNLSQRFASGGGSSSLETRIEQLRRTIAQIAGKHKVYLNIEGQRLGASSGDGLEISQPINM